METCYIMRNIIVTECYSTGKHFIGDIINRGYNPIVLHLKNNADTGLKNIPWNFLGLNQ